LPRPLPSHGLIELLDIPRFSLLRSLHIQDLKLDLHRSLAAKLLRYIDSNTNLSSIDLSSSNLSTVPAFPLAESLSRVGTVRLSATKLTLEQATALLRKLATIQPRRTHSLDLSFNDLRFLEASLLVAAIKHLSSLDLSYTDIGDTRTMEVMEGVANSQLQVLDLSGCGLARTSLDSIGLNQQLSKLTLAEVAFNPEKLDPMVTNLSLVRNLAYIDLSRTVLTETDPILLADCVGRIREVKISFCWLYKDHVEFLLDKITDEGSATKRLELSGNHLELVDKELLVAAADTLVLLALEWCNLEPWHVVALAEEERSGVVVLSEQEIKARLPDVFRVAKMSPGITLSREASHEAPATDLLQCL